MTWLQWLWRLWNRIKIPDIPPIGDEPEIPGSSDTEALRREINVVRLQYGLPTLQRSACLEARADEHCRCLHNSECEPHDGWLNRLKRCGYDAGSGQENVAFNTRDAKQAVAVWMQSSGHRRNVLGNWTCCGGAKVGKWWTVMFGRDAQ